jgi:acylphosphatase
MRAAGAARLQALLLGALWVALVAADDATEGLPGWRMTDRFAGIRFEVHGRVQGVGYRAAAQAEADELACFGWVQNTARGTVVGEARCAKVLMPRFREWLRAGPPSALVDHVVVRDMPDTKIRFHFSDFKILPDSRVTCFADEPHQCPPPPPEVPSSEPPARDEL